MTRNSILTSLLAAGAISGLWTCGGAGQNPVTPAPPNQPPVVTKVELEGYTTAGFGAQLPIHAEVHDPDGDAVTCAWKAQGGRVLVDSRDTCVGVYFAPDSGSTDRVDVVPTDAKGTAGSTGTLTIPLTADSIAVAGPTSSPSPDPPPKPRPSPVDPSPVDPTPAPNPQATPTPAPGPTPTPVPNHPPTVTLSGGGSCHPNPTCSRAFSASAADPDGDPISYVWSGSGCSGSGATGSALVTAIQQYTCTVTVSDGRGGTAKASGTAQGTNQTPTVTGIGNFDPIICGASTCALHPDWSPVFAGFTVADDDTGGGSCTATANGGCNSVSCTPDSGFLFTTSGGGPGVECTICVIYTDRWGARSAQFCMQYPVNINPN